MKTTLNIKDDLLKAAMDATGIKEKTALVHLGLQELVNKNRLKRLIAMGGTDPKAKAAPRRRKK
jgi:Arc/MetJ family transcription regulator